MGRGFEPHPEHFLKRSAYKYLVSAFLCFGRTYLYGRGERQGIEPFIEGKLRGNDYSKKSRPGISGAARRL